MSAAAALLTRVQGLGIVLWRQGDQLRYRGSQGDLTPDLIGELRRHKAELLQMIAAGEPCSAQRDAPAPDRSASVKLFMPVVETWPPDTRDLWEERAAVLEFDWGMSRDEAELEAFNRITAGSSPEPAPVPASAPEHAPACGHTDALVVIHVTDYGSLCGPCWTRWVAGGMDWPEQHGDQS